MPIEVIASPNTIVSNLRHSENKDRAIEVTLLEIVADISPSQKQNADSPIEITLLGIVTDINPLHPSYVDIADYQLFVVNTIEKWSGFYLKT